MKILSNNKPLVYLTFVLGCSLTQAFEQMETETHISSEQVLIDPSQLELKDEASLDKYNQIMDFNKRFLGAFQQYGRPEKLRSTAEQMKLKQYEEIWEPFTTTSYYDYSYAFTEGLALDNYYDYSTECIDNLFYTLDDYFYFLNNLTLETNDYFPFINFTGGVAQNLSEGVGNCFLFGDDAIIYIQEQWQSFEDSNTNQNAVVNYVISFIFTQMGNAQTYLNIFDAIQEDIENQNYEDIWHQYGRLINNILDVSPIESEGLEKAALSDTELETMLRNHPNFGLVTMDNFLIGSAFVKAAQWVKNDIDKVQVYIPSTEDYHSLFEISDERKEQIDDNIHWYNTHSKIPRGANHGKKAGSNIQKAHNMLGAVSSWDDLNVGQWPAFSASDDTLPLVVGILEGMVNVFESDSYVQLCEANITNVLPISTNIASYWVDAEYETCMEWVHDLLVVPYGVTMNCYMTFYDGLNYDNYYWLVADNVWVTNIVFNIGYIYNDILSLIIIDYTTDDFSGNEFDSFWYDAGFYIGDLVLRFLYTSSENHLDSTSTEDHEHDID